MPRKSERTTYECSYHLLPNMQITNGTEITDHDITEEPWCYQGKTERTTQPANLIDHGFIASTNFLPGLLACYYPVTQPVILQFLSSTSWTWPFASNLHVNSKTELTHFVVTRQCEIDTKHTGTVNVSLPMD